MAVRCRFIFVDYFLVVERCNRTVKPEREIRTTINQMKMLCGERVRKVRTNIYKRWTRTGRSWIYIFMKDINKW